MPRERTGFELGGVKEAEVDLAVDAFDPKRLLADQRWLLALARNLVGDEQLAEDVAQETHLLAWRHPPGDPSRAGGWLRRIASNVASRLRSRDASRLLREQVVARPEALPATDELVARV